MDKGEVLSQVEAWAHAQPGRRVVALGEQADFASHIRAFEGAMSDLIALNNEDPTMSLGLALPFDPVERRAEFSYRRALKKYTHAVIFEDLGLSLLLVRAGRPLQVISPDGVNRFLAGLNEMIAAGATEKRADHGEGKAA